MNKILTKIIYIYILLKKKKKKKKKDSTIRIWNVSTGKKVYTKLIHKDEWYISL